VRVIDLHRARLATRSPEVIMARDDSTGDRRQITESPHLRRKPKRKRGTCTQCVGSEWRAVVIVLSLFTAYQLAGSIGRCEANVESQRRALFAQPEVSGIAGRLYVVEP
ncbi:MAG: hypothetical protein ACOCWL_04290, partial [Thermoguttaceae bacterium]